MEDEVTGDPVPHMGVIVNVTEWVPAPKIEVSTVNDLHAAVLSATVHPGYVIPVVRGDVTL